MRGLWPASVLSRPAGSGGFGALGVESEPGVSVKCVVRIKDELRQGVYFSDGIGKKWWGCRNKQYHY